MNIVSVTGIATVTDDMTRVAQFIETTETWNCEGISQLILAVLRILLNTLQITFVLMHQNVRKFFAKVCTFKLQYTTTKEATLSCSLISGSSKLQENIILIIRTNTSCHHKLEHDSDVRDQKNPERHPYVSFSTRNGPMEFKYCF